MQIRCSFVWTSLLILAPFCILSGCTKGDGSQSLPAANISNSANEASGGSATEIVKPVIVREGTNQTAGPPPVKVELYPEVLIKTSVGEIRVKLNAEKAPLTVDNFLENYVARDFYQETIFHFVEKDFIAAGGGYTADLEAKETRAEIFNEAANGLKNSRGTIAMARNPDYVHSAMSQFFINLNDNSELDHIDKEKDENYGYCVFGEVVEGMGIVDQIAAAEVRDEGDFANVPVQPIVIQSVERIK